MMVIHLFSNYATRVQISWPGSSWKLNAAPYLGPVWNVKNPTEALYLFVHQAWSRSGAEFHSELEMPCQGRIWATRKFLDRY